MKEDGNTGDIILPCKDDN